MSEPSGDVQSQDGSGGDGSQQTDPPVDWSQFPTIGALMQVGSTEEWLQYIGVDPSVLSSQQ